MTAQTRDDWNETAAELLAEAVQALSEERDVARLCEIGLVAAMEQTGADGGRVRLTEPPGEETRAQRGEPGPGPGLAERLLVAGEQAGVLELWGDSLPAQGGPALRVLVTQLSQGLANAELARRAAAQRGRARRFAEAVRAMRGVLPTEQAVLRLVDEGRKLVAGAAAALVTARPGEAGPTVGVGLDPDLERELAGLVCGPLYAHVGEGRPWRGAVPAGSPLRDAGLVGLALVPVGDEADRIGTLAVLTREHGGVPQDELEALWSLADHATAALGAAALRERLDDLGTVDPVTRFFNGRYFATRLEQEVHRALRGREALSLAIVAIDGLEQVRAASGEAAAQAAVAALAEHMVPRLRATDVGCRTAPDQLSLILPASSGLDAYRIAERIRDSFAAEAALGHGVALSAGVASFPDQAGTADQLADFARAALALARRHGGERTFLYDRDVARMLEEEDRRGRLVEDSLVTTISALAVAVDDRHPTTRDHSRNVARLSALIARELGMPVDAVEEVRLAGLLHDVGKIGVTDELVTRAGPLEPHEWEEMRQHPEIGYRMLSGTRLRDVRRYVRFHHERWDGAGYPTGCAGEDIPLESRIVAVANAYDTMVNDRPYRLAVAEDEAIARVRDGAGTQFCPVVVEAFLGLVARDPGALDPASEA